MSNSGTDQIYGSATPVATELTASTRIDAPHPTDVAPAVEAGAMAVEAPSSRDSDRADHEAVVLPSTSEPEAIAQLVRTQAGQLAEHLRARQKDLDHREAALNARAAQLDRDERAARLWLAERSAELHEREPATEPLRDEEARRQDTVPLAAREQRLAEAEAGLAAAQAEAERLLAQLIEDRRLLEEETRNRRERLDEERRHWLAELAEKRRAVEHRSEQTDQARASLEQLRGELGRMHRETLEIRLATEELWAELSTTAPPAALTRSLGRIRSQLADHYRMSNAELQQKREELEQLRGQLAEQYEKLLRQKRQFDQWSAGCREEVEQQSARLQARSLELDRRENSAREQSLRAEAERLELQQEVRRLQARLTATSAVLVEV